MWGFVLRWVGVCWVCMSLDGSGVLIYIVGIFYGVLIFGNWGVDCGNDCLFFVGLVGILWDIVLFDDCIIVWEGRFGVGIVGSLFFRGSRLVLGLVKLEIGILGIFLVSWVWLRDFCRCSIILLECWRCYSFSLHFYKCRRRIVGFRSRGLGGRIIDGGWCWCSNLRLWRYERDLDIFWRGVVGGGRGRFSFEMRGYGCRDRCWRSQ